MIVPLLSGSGIRVKIIEGMALGKVIITTTVGLEGIPAQSGVNILIANEPADFLRIIKDLINKRGHLLFPGDFLAFGPRKLYHLPCTD